MPGVNRVLWVFEGTVWENLVGGNRKTDDGDDFLRARKRISCKHTCKTTPDNIFSLPIPETANLLHEPLLSYVASGDVSCCRTDVSDSRTDGQ